MKQNRKNYARVTKVGAFFFYPVTIHRAELLVMLHIMSLVIKALTLVNAQLHCDDL